MPFLEITLTQARYLTFPDLASAPDDGVYLAFHLILENLCERSAGPATAAEQRVYGRALLLRYADEPRDQALSILLEVQRNIDPFELHDVDVVKLVESLYATDCADFPMPLPGLA